MSLKKTYQKILGNPQNITQSLFISAKWTFLLFLLAFSLSYFFLSVSLFQGIIEAFFSPLYIGYFVSFIFLLVTGTFNIFAGKGPKILPIIISAVWILLGGYFLFTMI